MKFALIVFMVFGKLSADGANGVFNQGMMSLNKYAKPEKIFETREECYKAGRLYLYQNYPGNGKGDKEWFMLNSNTKEFSTFVFECREIEKITYK